jgi:hypothetical protein
MALSEYAIDDNVEETPLDIFRNTKRLVLRPSKVDHPLVWILLAQTRHTLEEVCVGGSFHTQPIDAALVTLLKTLKWLDTKVSAINVRSRYAGSDFGKVARILATDFKNLRNLELYLPDDGVPRSEADLESILRTCSNLQSFECCRHSHHRAVIRFQSGNLTLFSVSSHSLLHAAFERFGEMMNTLDWTFTEVIDDDLVLLTNMCSKLQQFKFVFAKNVTDEGVIRALSSLPHLTSIELRCCNQLTVAGMKAPIERCRLLQRFKVHHTIGDSGSGHSYFLSYECGKLRIEDLSVHCYSLLRAALQRFGASITSLDCKWLEVSDNDLAPLTSMCSKLQKLELKNAKTVTDGGLIRALSSLPHLTSIRLSGCDQLTVAGLQTLIESRWPLRYFRVERDEKSTGDEMMDYYEIYDYDNKFGFDDGVITSNGDLYWPLVELWTRRLRDAWPEVGDDGVTLMTSMCSKLQELILENAKNVTDEDLIRALSPLSHLTSISLRACDQLTVAGLKALIESRWPLRYFYVGRDRIDTGDEMMDCYKIDDYENMFYFNEGVITGKGDLYWPLVEVLTCRQRDAPTAIEGSLHIP